VQMIVVSDDGTRLEDTARRIQLSRDSHGLSTVSEHQLSDTGIARRILAHPTREVTLCRLTRLEIGCSYTAYRGSTACKSGSPDHCLGVEHGPAACI
jgi:hypothetical protein